MTLKCDLYIDGHFEGTIESKNLITIGKNGKMNGEIRAEHLIVQGVVEGNIEVDRIEIKETGHVSGMITSSELQIEAKGVFEGESRIRNESRKAGEISLPSPKKDGLA